MKKCPSCSRIYDDSQSFCLDDGTALIAEPVSNTAETVVMQPKKKSKLLPILFVSIIALLFLGIAAGYFLIQRNYGDVQRSVTNVRSTPPQIQPQNNSITTASSPSTASADAPQVKVENSAIIATKDIGSLRVALKSFSPLKLNNGQAGVRVVFEFTNLEKEKLIVVAMNANGCDYGCSQINLYLRSTLVDENGGVWRIANTDVEGMSTIGVGAKHHYLVYNPAEVVEALTKRDEIKSDILQENGVDLHVVFGSMTEMPAGQSKVVTVSFAQDQAGTGAPPKVFQMASEIVVGVVTAGAKTSYSLHNVTFDKISLQGRE